MKAATWPEEWVLDYARPLGMTKLWRGVETQYMAAALKLVDNLEEHDILERLLEESKPALPSESRGKHYLLTSPFRYFPQHSSRFRPANQSGLWYGASVLEGACSEIAYWRMRFIHDSAALVKADSEVVTEHTFFQASVEGLCIDLMDAPWSAFAHLWKHSADYSATHALAEKARQASVQWIRYESVRAPACALAAALTVDAVHGETAEIEGSRQEWVCKATRNGVMMLRKAGGPGQFEWHE